MQGNLIYLPGGGRKGIRAPEAPEVQVIAPAPVNIATRRNLIRPVLGSGLVARWVANHDNTSTILSTDWGNFFGNEEAEISKRGWINLIHPDDKFDVTMDWLKGRNSGEPYQTTALALVYGVYRPVTSLAFPVRSACGQLVRWEGYCQLVEEAMAVNF